MKLNQGYFILFFQQILAFASLSFMTFFFKKQGYSMEELVLLYVFFTFMAVLFTSLTNVFNLRYFLVSGILAFAGMNLLLFFNWPGWSFWLYPFLGAGTALFFWISLNYLFFRDCADGCHGRRSAVYQICSSLLGVFLPSLGALFIVYKSYSFLFLLCAFLHLPLLFYVWKKVPAITLRTRLASEMEKFRGLRIITMAEGALQFFSGVVLVIYSLFFISREQQFGFFLGYLGLISLVIAFFLSWRSDKLQKRMGYLYFLFFLMAFSVFALIFAPDLKWWVILTGIFSLLATISFPLRLAVSLDLKKAELGFWRMRELFLNIGRAITFSLTFIFFHYRVYWLTFVVFGMIALLYPFLIHYKFRRLK